MGFLHMFSGMKRKEEPPAEPRAEKPERPSCPAGLDSNEIIAVDSKKGYFICSAYERTRGTKEKMHPEHCPFCPYNSTNLTKRIDENFYQSCADLVGEEKARKIFRRE